MAVRVISQQIVFKPPGKCIYCGSPGDPKLHTEHIIPESLGARFEFLKASCHACSVKTGAVEGHVVSRLFGDTRAFLGMRRGKKRKWPEKFSVHVKPETETDRSSSLTMTTRLEGYEKKGSRTGRSAWGNDHL
jgi:5-methylcytosine-specific restriction endonuclease McrA